MAFSTTSVDINRTSTITLPSELSAEIFAAAEDQSAVMQLARRIDVPGRGLTIPVVTGEPVAAMVAETNEKPVSNATLSTKLMTPKTFAVIELFSNEFRRDASALYDELVRRLPAAIAKAFDAQCLTGTAVTGFDSMANVTTISQGAGVIDDITAAIQGVAAEGYNVDGYAVSPAYYANILTALDGNGRPLFVGNGDIHGANVGNIFGAPVVKTKGETLMLAGDWTQAAYGIVDGINIAYSDAATINDGTNQINLWQRNMFAVRVEAEMGFVCADTDAFRRITA